MANKAWTQQEVLDRLQELNPKPGFAVRELLPGGDETLDYPASLHMAASQIAHSQTIYGYKIESIEHGNFLDPERFWNPDQVQVKMTM